MTQTTLLAPEDTADVRPVTHEVSPLTIFQFGVEHGIPPDQLRECRELIQATQDNQAAEEYGRSLAAFQADCPQIKKERSIDLGGGKGPQYASLDDIDVVIRPLLARHGLSVSYTEEMTTDGRIKAVCKVRRGRHTESAEVTLPVPTQMRVNDTQKASAGFSYAKRAALCAALNIVVTDEDTDANGMATTITEEQVATLEEWIANVGANRQKFLEVYKIAALSELPATLFTDAIQKLNRKGNQRK